MSPNVEIRKATKDDCKGIHHLLMELAEYERMPHNVHISEADLVADGFGDDKFYHALVAELKNDPGAESTNASSSCLVGYALYFYTYSTWDGRAAHLEDIYVKQEQRDKGIGTRLLKTVTEDIRSRGCVRLDLTVLNWNTPSLGFYRHFGAKDLTETEGWNLLRFDKEHLDKMLT